MASGNFSKILGNQKVLSVFLSIASNEMIYDYEIAEALHSSVETIQPSLDELEKTLLIEKNPGQVSRKFKLAFSGQLFATQLKNTYPEIKKIMGSRKIIEPVDLNVN